MFRKKMWMSITVLLAVALVIYGVRTYRQTLMQNDYLTYKSTNPVFDFSFKYPQGWKPAESKGVVGRYDDIQVIGPRDKQNLFSAGFSITVKPDSKKNTEDLLTEHLRTSSRFSKFKVIETKKSTVDHYKTSVASFQYTMLLPPLKTNAKEVLLKGKTLFLAKDNKSYRISFLSTAEQFDQYGTVFNEVIKTFQFTK